jgi:hypothetical protein
MIKSCHWCGLRRANGLFIFVSDVSIINKMLHYN